MESVHEPKLGICHLPGVRATYFEHVLLLIFLCANDSQLIMKYERHSNATCPKDLPLEFFVEHLLVVVNLCGRCAVVALFASNCKASQNNHKIMISRFVS